MHEEVIGLTGLRKPCGSSTSLIPAGVVCDSFTWHMAHLRVSPGSLRAHCRVADVGEILITGMNAVNHKVEAVTLGRLIRIV